MKNYKNSENSDLQIEQKSHGLSKSKIRPNLSGDYVCQWPSNTIDPNLLPSEVKSEKHESEFLNMQPEYIDDSSVELSIDITPQRQSEDYSPDEEIELQLTNQLSNSGIDKSKFDSQSLFKHCFSLLYSKLVETRKDEGFVNEESFWQSSYYSSWVENPTDEGLNYNRDYLSEITQEAYNNSAASEEASELEQLKQASEDLQKKTSEDTEEKSQSSETLEDLITLEQTIEDEEQEVLTIDEGEHEEQCNDVPEAIGAPIQCNLFEVDDYLMEDSIREVTEEEKEFAAMLIEEDSNALMEAMKDEILNEVEVLHPELKSEIQDIDVNEVLTSEKAFNVEDFFSVDQVLRNGAMACGHLEFDAPARLEGAMSGSISSTDLVVVGSEAVVNADMQVDSLVVFGVVEGEIKAKNSVVIFPGGQVIGDISSPSLEVKEGAEFLGACHQAVG